jgi:DNA-directed RNA polymerase subunit RPC12/RpoP
VTVIIGGVERRCGRCGGELHKLKDARNEVTGEPLESKYHCHDCGQDHIIMEVGLTGETSTANS